MPATESVPDSLPRHGGTRRARSTKSTNRVHRSVDGRQSGRACSGTHRHPPAASVRGNESHTMTGGPTPSLGTNPRQTVADKGRNKPGGNKRTTDSGSRVPAPALEEGHSRAGGSAASPTVVQPSNNGQMAVEQSCPPSRRPKSRARRSRPKKRSRFPPPPVCTAHPPMPPEDWEKDIQEVELVDWERRSFGSQPYGPEDLISFSLRDVSLYSVATEYSGAILPIMAVFSPARGHPGPVAWTCPRAPPEEGQFTDPED